MYSQFSPIFSIRPSGATVILCGFRSPCVKTAPRERRTLRIECSKIRLEAYEGGRWHYDMQEIM